MDDKNGFGARSTENLSFRQLYALLLTVRQDINEIKTQLRALRSSTEAERNNERQE